MAKKKKKAPEDWRLDHKHEHQSPRGLTEHLAELDLQSKMTLNFSTAGFGGVTESSHPAGCSPGPQKHESTATLFKDGMVGKEAAK